MRDVVILFVHLIVTAVRLARPGGLRSVVAESVLVKHQLLILNRGRKRAPNLRSADRVIAGLCTLFMPPVRVLRSNIVLKPSTLLHLHHLLAKRKYQMLFSTKRGRQPGPKGPSQELVDAVVEMKRQNLGAPCLGVSGFPSPNTSSTPFAAPQTPFPRTNPADPLRRRQATLKSAC
jgi:putative transposase